MKAQKMKWNIVSAMEFINDSIYKKNFKVDKKEKYNNYIEKLNNYFGTTEIQTWFICFLVYDYFENGEEGCNFSNFANFMDCNVMKIVKYTKSFKELIDRKLISITSIHRRRGYSLDDDDSNSSRKVYMITKDVVNSIVENKTLQIEIEEEEKTDNVSFVNFVSDKVESRQQNEVRSLLMFRQLSDYEDENRQLEMVKKTKLLLPAFQNRALFYDFCSDFLSGHDSSLNTTLSDFFENSKSFTVANQFLSNSHPLLKKELVEFVKKGCLSDATLTLTEKGKNIFLGEDAHLFEKQLDDKLLIQPEKITPVKLYYSTENQQQLDKLQNALSDKRLPEIQSRLKKQRLPVGVAALLYGAPGTGKTESVLQIAKATGRQVLHVDISDTKSCWFGESEKMIKKVFTNYKNMCALASKKSNGKIPILFFNEADAVFAKRKDTENSNVAQTENAIQNIILEELENLSGILVATTNLATNLDPAFERRFLFKIKFEKPSAEAKTKIWQTKLPWLSNNNAEYFAKKFDFSGGEINNIVRKITMDEVITGERPELHEIEDLCNNEKIEKSSENKIGFLR
ncbi:MAG: ATP-binding protein [Treponema sp.]